MMGEADPRQVAAEVLTALGRDGATLAVAESLTGGMLAETITAVPGASRVFVGAVVAYSAELKVRLVGVPRALVDAGVVSADVAEAMATGVRERAGSTWALSTTGVAGPDEQEGRPVGTVHLGWAGPGGAGSEQLWLTGDRAVIREAACAHALTLLHRRLGKAREQPVPGSG